MERQEVGRLKNFTESPLSSLIVLNKLIFPQVGEKFLPGKGQNIVGKGTYRVLADQNEIFKYPFFFQIFQAFEVISADFFCCFYLYGGPGAQQEVHLVTVFGSPVSQGESLAPVTQVSPQLHTDELFKAFSVKIWVAVQCFSPGQYVCDAGIKEITISFPIMGQVVNINYFPYSVGRKGPGKVANKARRKI